jgi:hypothetical protein
MMTRRIDYRTLIKRDRIHSTATPISWWTKSTRSSTGGWVYVGHDGGMPRSTGTPMVRWLATPSTRSRFAGSGPTI